MNPHVAAQIHSIIEDLRLMEAFVTAPPGLHSDIRMLRQSMTLPEAADLPREQERQRRMAYRSLTDDPPRMALSALERLSTSLASLHLAREGTGSPLGAEWTARARRVLSRAESHVAGDMRAGTAAGIKGLYVIVDPEATRGRPVVEVALAALQGGASVIQLRDKTHDGGAVLRTARAIRSMCVDHGALFVMNDDPSLALASHAHGLHLGQGDLPALEARRVLRPEQVLGLSNNSMDEVARSQAAGADYLAVGAVFPTKTMGKSARPALGTEMLAKVRSRVSQPVVAIGGINRENIAQVVRAGADCVCVVSAVTLADSPRAAAGELVQAIQNAKSRPGSSQAHRIRS